MWRLNVRMPVVVYLNFRSFLHMRCAQSWLERGGWSPSNVETTVSSGIPNGPYSGPVFYKAVETGVLELYGSGCGEGTYFVFVATDSALFGGLLGAKTLGGSRPRCLSISFGAF